MRLTMLFALLGACSDSSPKATSCALSPDENIALIEAGASIGDPECLLRSIELDGPLRLAELIRAKSSISDDPFGWSYRSHLVAWPSPERIRALLPFVGPKKALLGAARAGLVDEVRRLVSGNTGPIDTYSAASAAAQAGCHPCLDIILARDDEHRVGAYRAMQVAVGRDDLALVDKLLPYASLREDDLGTATRAALAMFELAWPELSLRHSIEGAHGMEQALEGAVRANNAALAEHVLARGAWRDTALLRWGAGPDSGSRSTFEKLLGPELTESDRLQRAAAPRRRKWIWLLSTDASLVPDDLRIETHDLSDEAIVGQRIETTRGATTHNFEVHLTNTCKGLEPGWSCARGASGAYRVQLATAPAVLHDALRYALADHARGRALWFEGPGVLPATGLAIDVGSAIHQTFVVRRVYGERLVVWDRVITDNDAYELAYGPCDLLAPDREATPQWQSLGDYDSARAALDGCFALHSDMPGLASGITSNPLLRAIDDAIEHKRFAQVPDALLTTKAYSNGLESWREHGDWQREGNRHVRRAPALPRRAIEARRIDTCSSPTWTETSSDESRVVWCRAGPAWGDGPRAYELVFEAASDDRAWIPGAIARFDAELRPENDIPPTDGLGARNRTYARIVASLRAGRYPPGLRSSYAQLERDIAAREGPYGTRAPGVAQLVLAFADTMLDYNIRTTRSAHELERDALAARGIAPPQAPAAIDDAARGLNDDYVQRWLDVATDARLAFDPTGLITDLALESPTSEHVAALITRVSDRGSPALRLEYLGVLVHAATLVDHLDDEVRARVLTLIEAKLGARARVDGTTTRRWVARWRDALTRLDPHLAWRLARAHKDAEGDAVDREARRLIARWVVLSLDASAEESGWAQALTTDPLTQVWFRRGDDRSLASYLATLAPPSDAAWLAKFVGFQILGRMDSAEALAVEHVPPSVAAWEALGRFVRGEKPAL